MVNLDVLRQDPKQLATRDQRMQYLDELAKTRDAPGKPTRKDPGSLKRCPACRDAYGGKGCYISACDVNRGRPCDCHFYTGMGHGTYGMTPQEIFHWAYVQKQQLPHVVNRL